MRDLLVTLIVFGSVPFIIRYPYIGVYVWSWLSYMNPHRLTWGFAYNMPFAAIVGATLLLSVLFTKDRQRIPWTPVTITLLVFTLWMILTTVFAYDIDASMFDFERTMKIMLMTFVMMILINTRKKLNILVWVIALSIGFFGIKGGVFVILSAGQYRVWGPEGTFFFDNNALALTLIMTIPLFRYLQTQVEDRKIKWVLTVCMGLMALSAISSYSRGAFLAIAAMSLFLWLKGNKKFITGIALVIAAAGILIFMPAQYFERISTIKTYEEDESAMGRINAWWYAYNLAKDRPLGAGFGGFNRELFQKYAPDPLDFHDAHSVYFEVLGEHGFLGLFFFLLLLFLTFRTASWIIKNTRSIPELNWANHLAAMLQVSLVGYLVGGAFLGLAYFDLLYNLIAIIVLTRMFVQKEITEHGYQPQAQVGLRGDPANAKQRAWGK